MTNEVSKEEGNKQSDRPGHNGEGTEYEHRQSNREYLDEFEKIFSEENDVGGSREHEQVETDVGESGNSETDEYEGYEEW
jgi:hypothetical protein